MPGGRPKYEITEEICGKAETLAAQGLNMEQIADCLGISYDTLNERRKEFSEFSVSIKRGQAKGIGILTNKLFERGKGFSHPEEKIFCNKDGDVTRVETMKHYPPDTTAAIFYLKNRAGWKDVQEIDHSIGTRNNGGVSRASQILNGFRGSRSDDVDAGTMQK